MWDKNKLGNYRDNYLISHVRELEISLKVSNFIILLQM